MKFAVSEHLIGRVLRWGLWVATILLLVLALVAGLISALLSIVNASRVPKLPFARPLSLYVCNVIAGKL